MVDYRMKVFLIYITASTVHATFSAKKEHLNKILLGYAFIGDFGVTLHECVRHCKSNDRCKSINFLSYALYCDLNNASSSEVDISNFENNPRAVFFDMTEWMHMRGGCEGSTCGDNETCFPTGPTYVCKQIKHCDHMCLPNGSTNDTSTEVGTYLEIICDNGYILLGDAIIYCMVNGYWSDSPLCF